MHTFTRRTLLIGVLCSGLISWWGTPAVAGDNLPPAGAVFVGTNHNNTHPTAPLDEPANQVVMYNRANDGTLSLVGRFNTGGQGSGPSIRFAGDGLGSSHSLQLSHDRRWLFVVNAASNDISVFRVSKKGLELTDLVPSGGVFPNSITQYHDLVYVLNSAGEGDVNIAGERLNGNITGFRLSNQGTLTPIPGSTRIINANQDPVRPDTLFNPAQVAFTPDGRQLVVTIKDGPRLGDIPGVIPTGPGRILVFGVGRDGLPTAEFARTDLDNHGPFGFSFDRQGNLLVALFIGGPGLTGAAGSFHINPDGSLIPITPDVTNGQLDTCWLENNGRYAFGANYTSGDITSYRIGNDGSLTLLDPVAGTTDNPLGKIQGSTPLDLGISADGRYLYNVLPGSGRVAGWRINSNGSLTKIGEFPGLPDAINGDVAMCGISPDLEECEFGPGGSPAGIAAY